MQQLAQGVTVEQITAMYFDSDALIEPPYTVYRMDNRGQRWYYRILFEGKPEFYLSVTSLCQATLPTSPQLIRWIAELGQREARRIADIKAHYGTLMHKLCADLLINLSVDLGGLEEAVEGYRAVNGLTDYDVRGWADDLRQDLLAFAQFVRDKNVKPLAIEVVVTHPGGYAGAIDLVCEMDYVEKGKRKPRRVIAIVDLKSGRKGFYEAHEVQLRAYMEAWNITFSQQVTHVFNWSPKDWRTSPGYNLKDQTEAPSAAKFDYLVAIARIEREKREKQVLKIGGMLNLDAGPDDNYKLLGMSDAIEQTKEAGDHELKLFES